MLHPTCGEYIIYFFGLVNYQNLCTALKNCSLSALPVFREWHILSFSFQHILSFSFCKYQRLYACCPSFLCDTSPAPRWTGLRHRLGGRAVKFISHLFSESLICFQFIFFPKEKSIWEFYGSGGFKSKFFLIYSFLVKMKGLKSALNWDLALAWESIVFFSCDLAV